MAAKHLKEVEKKPDSMYSPVALTFSAEIKRMSVEKGLPIGEVFKKLARFSGVSETHLYNYRSGKTDIPALLIPVFCKQFESNALAMAVVGLCDVGDFDAGDAMDLINFTASAVKDILAGYATVVEAFKDGHIDGHELLEIKNSMAAIVRTAHRTTEIATRLREAKQCVA
jgi:hypothetical protein